MGTHCVNVYIVEDWDGKLLHKCLDGFSQVKTHVRGNERKNNMIARVRNGGKYNLKGVPIDEIQGFLRSQSFPNESVNGTKKGGSSSISLRVGCLNWEIRLI